MTRFLPLSLFCYLLISSQLDLIANLDGYDQSRVLQDGVLTVAACFASVRWLKQSVRPSRYSVLAVLFISTGIVSASHSVAGFEGLVETARVGGLLVLSAEFAHSIRADPATQRRPLILAIFVPLLVLVLSMFLMWSCMLSDGLADTKELFRNFANRRYFGHIATFGVPVLLGVHLSRPKSLILAAASLATAVGLTVLAIACGSRGSWIAMLAGMLIVLLFFRSSAREFIQKMLILALVSLILYVLVFAEIPKWLGAEILREDRLASLAAGSLSGRGELWRRALEMIEAAPVLGFGPMSFAANWDVYGAHPHNAILQFAAEWGGLGAAFSLGMVLAITWEVRQAACRQRASGTTGRFLLMGLSSAFFGAIVLSLVDGVFVVPDSEIWFFVCSGWLLGECRSLEVESTCVSDDGSSCRRIFGLSILALVLVGTMIQFVYIQSELPRIEKRQAMQLESSNFRSTVFPRYWLGGRL